MLNLEAGGEAMRFPELPEGIPPWAFLGFPAPSWRPLPLAGESRPSRNLQGLGLAAFPTAVLICFASGDDAISNPAGLL